MGFSISRRLVKGNGGKGYRYLEGCLVSTSIVATLMPIVNETKYLPFQMAFDQLSTLSLMNVNSVVQVCAIKNQQPISNVCGT